MSRDDLEQIPSIVPTRDAAPNRGNRRGRGQPDRRHGAAQPAKGGAGIFARLFITVSLAAAGVACAWAWQLQLQLEQADQRMVAYAERIGDLEARLSDTDEGMTQSAAAQAVKLRELDSEVRKLWDNVWKSAKARLGKLEAASASQGTSIDKMEKTVGSVKSELDGASADITKLKSVAGDLSRLMASAKANQAEVERVADTLNRIDLELAKLSKRVQENEEWVNSINASRRQINAQVEDLRTSLRAMQQTP